MRTRMRLSRGAALLVVLLSCLVLFVMVKALVVMAHSGSFQSRQQYARVAGLYAAEAALTEVRTRLAADPGWVAGFHDVQMSDMPATYTVRFNVAGNDVGPDESVNNLSGKTPVDGPRGEETVLPHTAEIVVTTRVHGYTRRLHVVLTPGSDGQAYPYALASSGHVTLSGNVVIDGIRSLEDSTAVEAGLHSNRSGGEAGIVTWKPLAPGDRAEVSGQVSTCGTSGSAIDFGGDPGAYAVAGGFQTGAASRPAPVGDILAEIAGASALPPPKIQPVGTTTLSAQRCYYDGDLKLNGDLILEDASLYVRGSLLVNGTVAGTGSLYVAGDTRFQGDATIRTNEVGVALYSKGNVHLSGFSGAEFMAALAAQDPAAAEYLEQVQGGLTAMLQSHVSRRRDMVTSHSVSSRNNRGTPRVASAADLGKLLAGDGSLGKKVSVNVTKVIPQKVGNRTRYTRSNRAVTVEPDALGKLIDRIDALPSGSTKEFLTGKLGDLKFQLDPNVDRTPAAPSGRRQLPLYQAARIELAQGKTRRGGLIAAMERGGVPGDAVYNYLASLTLNKLGSAYFQGVVYTNGHVWAANDLVVVGAIWAKDDGSQEPAVIDGTTVEPGDVVLGNGLHLTLNDEYVKTRWGEIGAGGGAGEAPEVQAWMEP